MNKYKKLSNVLTRNAYYAFLLVAVIGSALFLSSHYVETSIFENHNSVRKLEQAINTLRYTVVNTQRLSFQGAIFHDENTILMAAAESSKFYDNIEALRIEIEQYHVKLDETLQSDELHDHIIVDALQILDTIKGKYQQYLLLNISTSVKILEELPVSPDALVTLRSSQDQFQNDINKLQEKIGEIVLFNTSFIDSILHLPSYLFVLTFLIVIGLLYNFRLVTNKLLTAPVNMVLEHIHEINKTKKYTNVELPVTSVGEVAKLCEEINLVFKEIDDITVSKEALEVAKEEAVAAGNA
ncbi:MAG: hypothetical protein OEX00_08510, partial [Gammaproteobacteria bacterium]|nr:hypothetical protein [Gammaproteobacteria bacterium]